MIGSYPGNDILATPSSMFDWEGYFITTNNVINESAQRAKARIDSWAKLTRWLQNTYPDIYLQIASKNPELLVPEIAMAGLAGIYHQNFAPSQLGDAAEDSANPPTTSAGQSLLDKALDALKAIVPAKLEYDRQSKLLEANIRLAEQGKPLISSADLATQIAVRNPELEKLAGYALVGAFALGALYVFIKRRK